MAQRQQWVAYAIVAPHSSHGGDAFDDCMGTFGVAKLCVDESTIFDWIIGTFAGSLTVDAVVDVTQENRKFTYAQNSKRDTDRGRERARERESDLHVGWKKSICMGNTLSEKSKWIMYQLDHCFGKTVAE